MKYGIIKNEITEMIPLPLAVNGMATVACGEHAVLMGGYNVDGERLDTVLMFLSISSNFLASSGS